MKVLVIDDSILFRRIISDALNEIPGVEVVGKAGNGKIGLIRLKELNPDIITLDIEMPEMNGIEVLKAINNEKMEVGIIVLSAFTVKGGENTIKALQLGAFDFITKPEKGTSDENIKAISSELTPIIKAWKKKVNYRESVSIKINETAGKDNIQSKTETYMPENLLDIEKYILKKTGLLKPEIVVIAVSTGGPAALAEMLSMIKDDIQVPILIVQHMPPIFTKSLAKSLNSKCEITVKEAIDGEKIKRGIVYLAPGGKQMKISAGAGIINPCIKITDDPPENNCKPSADYLFRSVSSVYPGRILTVIMTGMGNDGSTGLRLIKRHGGLSIAQDEKSCVVYGMPLEAVRTGAVDMLLPLEMIATGIDKSLQVLR